MNKVIWKFTVPSEDSFTLMLPPGAEFLAVQDQCGTPQAWFAVDPDKNDVKEYGRCG